MKTFVSWMLWLTAWSAWIVLMTLTVLALLVMSPFFLALFLLYQCVFGPFALLDEINKREDFCYWYERDTFLLVQLWRWSVSSDSKP
jgi:hypothetical protein